MSAQEVWKWNSKADGSNKIVKLDDSAFYQTQSYITEICYFEYLLSLLFRWQKPFFFPIQSNINLIKFLAPLYRLLFGHLEIRSSLSRFEHCSESLI